jgi:hypothetical protein
LIIHKGGSPAGFRLPRDHLLELTGSMIRLEADRRGSEYTIERFEDLLGERNVYLGRRQLGWCAGAIGSGAWDYPFPVGFDR